MHLPVYAHAPIVIVQPATRVNTTSANATSATILVPIARVINVNVLVAKNAHVVTTFARNAIAPRENAHAPIAKPSKSK